MPTFSGQARTAHTLSSSIRTPCSVPAGTTNDHTTHLLQGQHAGASCCARPRPHDGGRGAHCPRPRRRYARRRRMNRACSTTFPAAEPPGAGISAAASPTASTARRFSRRRVPTGRWFIGVDGPSGEAERRQGSRAPTLNLFSCSSSLAHLRACGGFVALIHAASWGGIRRWIMGRCCPVGVGGAVS